ncbi:hypothetical protein PPYR_05163 [Photinus pyralis]|nr:gametocyte-specific factor 1 homolog isoform X2 [Photinus pyralis]XP_031333746.1 gametocyte-specific factor 1 homolog isoform X2 [Photinus pyralis]KAB0802977.1 hypothetical protein PPYR_05163 [Photinus pyralis]
MCPYNAAHLILAHRMQQHLVKCRQQHPEMQRDVCPNNSTHVIPAPEMPFHLESCPDRQNLDKFIFTSSSSEEKFPVPKLNLESTETWDDEYRPTYNPEAHCVNKPVLRNKNGLPQAQRRHFRMEERQRIQKFDTKEKEPTPRELEQNLPQKLRRPHGMSMAAGNQQCVEDPNDMSHLMNQIDIGSRTVAYPKMAAKQPDENEQISYAKMAGVGQEPTGSVKKVGRGRGLAQKNC